MNPSNFLQNKRPTTWEAVREEWRRLEEEVWRPHYEGLDYPSWIAWRKLYIDVFALEDRTWSMYDVTKPAEFIQSCLVGSFRGWQKYYDPDASIAMFKEIAEHPDLPNNEAVMRYVNQNPDTTQLMGFRSGAHLVIRDGTHRSAALAYSRVIGRPWTGKVTIALTDFGADEARLMIKAFDQNFAPKAKSQNGAK